MNSYLKRAQLKGGDWKTCVFCLLWTWHSTCLSEQLLLLCSSVLVRAPPCWGPVLPLFQVLWARPQPHTGGASGTLVLQPAGQQQQQWHQQAGAKAFQTVCEEESQAQEMCPSFHWLLWPQQGQVNLTSGAERVFGSQQGRRWVPFLPHCMTVKADKHDK